MPKIRLSKIRSAGKFQTKAVPAVRRFCRQIRFAVPHRCTKANTLRARKNLPPKNIAAFCSKAPALLPAGRHRFADTHATQTEYPRDTLSKASLPRG